MNKRLVHVEAGIGTFFEDQEGTPRMKIVQVCMACRAVLVAREYDVANGVPASAPQDAQDDRAKVSRHLLVCKRRTGN